MARSMWDTVKQYMDERHILCRPLPLSACAVRQPYLLERAGLSPDGNGTVFMLAVPYLTTRDALDPSRNVSVYAVPRDYHLFFKSLSEDLLPLLKREFPACTAALFADHSPIAEIEAACAAGLGDVGLNGLLLTPEYGSFVFLGELITDVSYHEAVGTDVANSMPPAPTLCTTCGLCRKACPMGCGESRDACLSALTQKKGILSKDEQVLLAKHPLVWGCDTCQTVCPVNRRILSQGVDTPIPFFKEDRLVHLTAEDIAGMTDEVFSTRAFSWRRRDTILRNLSIQSKNSNEGGTP